MRARCLNIAFFIFICPNLFSDTFTLSVHQNIITSPDGNFSEIYTKSYSFIDYGLLVNLYKGFGINIGYASSEESGRTSSYLNLATKLEQKFVILGINHIAKLSKSLRWKNEVSCVRISYKENAFGENYVGATIGYQIQTGLLFYVAKFLFFEISGGIINGSKKRDDFTMKFGGPKIAIGLGITL
jgi:hypothetical protein